MNIVSIYFLYFLILFADLSEGYLAKCICCGTDIQYDNHLSISYCPYCVKKHQEVWHYFIEFTKNKHNHVNESYASQYTPLDFMTGITPRMDLENYSEKVFEEFTNAVQDTFHGENCSFKNPDLETLFFSLFKEIQKNTPQSEQDFKELFQFYRELKWIYLALYYECNPTESYVPFIHQIFEEIDDTIQFLLHYQKQSNQASCDH